MLILIFSVQPVFVAHAICEHLRYLNAFCSKFLEILILVQQYFLCLICLQMLLYTKYYSIMKILCLEANLELTTLDLIYLLKARTFSCFLLFSFLAVPRIAWKFCSWQLVRLLKLFCHRFLRPAFPAFDMPPSCRPQPSFAFEIFVCYGMTQMLL